VSQLPAVVVCVFGERDQERADSGVDGAVEGEDDGEELDGEHHQNSAQRLEQQALRVVHADQLLPHEVEERTREPRRRCLVCAGAVVVAASVVRNSVCGRPNLDTFLLSGSSVGVGCIEGAAVHEDMVFFLYLVSMLFRRCSVIISWLETLLYVVLLSSSRSNVLLSWG